MEIQASHISFEQEYLMIKSTEIYENIIILKDGRISGCTGEGKIIIYNKEKIDTIDLTIKAFKNRPIFYHTELTNGQIIACSKSMKIIKLKINYFFMETYEIVQDIVCHNDQVFNKVVALDETRLISSLNDSTILFYKKRNITNIIMKNYLKLDLLKSIL